MSALTINPEKCDRCGMCVLECPTGAIVASGPHEVPTAAEGGEELCIGCGHCIAVCAPGALSHGEMKPEDLRSVSKGQLPSAEEAEIFLKSRRSTRAYRKEPVPRETLAGLIDIARYAPSGHNSQPVHWLVIEDPKETHRLAGMVVDWMRSMIEAMPQVASEWHFDLIAEAWDQGFDVPLHGAPHVVVAHARKDLPLAEGNSYIALTYLELAAYSLGLGGCWAGFFQIAAANYPPMTEALQLPDGHQCFGAMMIGHPRTRFSRIPARVEPSVIWR